MPPLTSIHLSGEYYNLHALTLDERNINLEVSIIGLIFVVRVNLILDLLDSRLIPLNIRGIWII
jgi:hypothetical protein